MSDDAAFTREIRDALAHLYDHTHLQRHALAERLIPPEAVVGRTRAQELRRILLDAIEALNPGDRSPIRGVERRPYAILFGLYVEGRERLEVAASLGISGRQLQRDQADAYEALASILRDRYLAPAPEVNPALREEPLRSESERLAQHREAVDIYDLLSGLLPLLEGLAQEQGVRVNTQTRPRLPQLYTNRTLIRQMLITLASHALANLPLVQLSFVAKALEERIGLGLRLEYSDEQAARSSETHPLTSTLKAMTTLAAALGAELDSAWLNSKFEEVWLWLPLQAETVVLVVDDNQALFALFQRYVAGRPYRLVHAGDMEQALALAQSTPPHIITLDLMMPGRDGWELLQALRAEASTARVPVVVCSVLEDPELALSLGAQAYLKKPVGQADLLKVLDALKQPV